MSYELKRQGAEKEQIKSRELRDLLHSGYAELKQSSGYVCDFVVALHSFEMAGHLGRKNVKN